MSQVIDVPGHGLVEFPDGMSNDEIVAAIKRNSMGPKYASQSDDPSKVGLTNAMESLNHGIYNAGGAATDWASNKGASPEVAGAAGYGTNLGLQILTSGLGMGGGKQGAPAFDWAGKKLMASALKPIYDQWKSGEARTAIQTLLDKGINATNGGVTTLKNNVGALDTQVEGLLAQNAGKTVNKYDVGNRLYDTKAKFAKQVNPQADLSAIDSVWDNFLAHPDLTGKTDIPVQVAQQLKKGTYKQLQGKYGELGSAEIEAQKGLARGLKETIGQAVPETVPALAEQSKLIDTLNVTERRALMDLNKNPGGLSFLAGNPVAAMGFMADKSALFKSIVARMLYSGQQVIPGGVGAAAGGVIGGILANPPPALGMEPY